jgi:hypothetical protein
LVAATEWVNSTVSPDANKVPWWSWGAVIDSGGVNREHLLRSPFRRAPLTTAEEPNPVGSVNYYIAKVTVYFNLRAKTRRTQQTSSSYPLSILLLNFFRLCQIKKEHDQK